MSKGLLYVLNGRESDVTGSAADCAADCAAEGAVPFVDSACFRTVRIFS